MNEADLDVVKKFMTARYPHLEKYNPAITWNDTETYWVARNGHADANGVTLSSRYGSVAALAGAYAHELLHVAEGPLGRVILTNAWDFFAPNANGLGWWHQQITNFGVKVGKEFKESKQ